jgi:hypothetical protein
MLHGLFYPVYDEELYLFLYSLCSYPFFLIIIIIIIISQVLKVDLQGVGCRELTGCFWLRIGTSDGLFYMR